jgi:hypothetical protein
MTERTRQGLFATSLGLYGLSLCLPAIVILDKPLFGGAAYERALLGFQCVAIGWMVVIGWIANPLYLIAVILHALRKRDAGAVFAWLAVVAALSSLLLVGADDWIGFEYPHVGFFAWLASMVVLAVACRRGGLVVAPG